MGSGAEVGLKAMRIKTLESAQAACSSILAECLANVKRDCTADTVDVQYDIDDLVCFACMASKDCEDCLEMPPMTLFAYPDHSELSFPAERVAEIVATAEKSEASISRTPFQPAVLIAILLGGLCDSVGLA